MRIFADPKRWLPVLVSGVAGTLVLLALVRPLPAGDMLLEIAQIITAMGLLLGIAGVVTGHIRAVARRARGWGGSVVIAIVTVLVFALELLPQSLGFAGRAESQALSGTVLRYVFQPLATSTLGLLTFFALRASWRALAVRPGEASIILGVAVVYLLAAGPWAGAIPGLSETLEWIRTYPVAGVTRGLLIGASLGVIVTTVRVLLGFDVPYLDR
jgi:hypothetical protein